MTLTKCCICGHAMGAPDSFHRELSPCAGCGSNARFRGLMAAVIRLAFNGNQKPLKDQAGRRDIVAIGMSDTTIYADILTEKLNYRNTFLHTEPHLDLCDPTSIAKYSNLDLIICSDVIEHTKEPPVVVLGNMMRMLRPGGAIVLSAPTYQMPETIEWYPGASSVRVIPGGDHHVVWKTIRGVDYVDTNPAFHGGPGDVLEMRVISHSALLADAASAGFKAATFEFDQSRGYVWPIEPEYPGLDAPMDGRILVLRKPKRRWPWRR
jgi:SAM-dependent methyltransferase